jgi:AmmeMemoRadiSam system protein B
VAHDHHAGDCHHPSEADFPAEEPLPSLRMDLDFQPSPVEENPGLLIRDTFRFSDTTLIIPQYLLRFLPYFDGSHTRGDLFTALCRSANRATALHLEAHLRETLDSAGFLEGARFQAARAGVLERFRQAPVRYAAHAGSAYPESAAEIRSYFDGNLQAHRFDEDLQRDHVIGVAAPHISFEGGWDSYAALVPALRHASPDSLFVVMGTSHYGELERFGLTGKVFETPLGSTRAEPELVAELASACPEATILEDYCHAVDHSLEFHVLLLQHLVKPDVRVLPILVGGFAQAMQGDTRPEEQEGLARVFGALREIAARQGRELFWLLSVDMAHVGKRYGDPFEAVAFQRELEEIEALDRDRVAMLARGDAAAFWRDVAKRDAAMKWCGSSTLYSFAQVYPEARAELLRYQQWNIDPTSVVSFGTMSFHRG